jgi:hypothetical protein
VLRQSNDALAAQVAPNIPVVEQAMYRCCTTGCGPDKQEYSLGQVTYRHHTKPVCSSADVLLLLLLLLLLLPLALV